MSGGEEDEEEEERANSDHLPGRKVDNVVSSSPPDRKQAAVRDGVVVLCVRVWCVCFSSM